MRKIVFAGLLTSILALSGCFGASPEDENVESAELPPITHNMQTTPEKGDTIATIKTNYGDIDILLYSELAPETVKNFTELAKEGKYDNVIFHRVIEDFMIQGGDFENQNGTGGYSYKGPGTSIPDEFGEGLTHIRGALSMANSGPNTGGSQFFIVHSAEGASWLDGKHAIFGFVYNGMDIVDKIATLPTNQEGMPLVTELNEVVMPTIEGVEVGEF